MEWKDIKGYEGYYKISPNGEVLSLTTKRILKKAKAKIGYYVVALWKDNKGKTKYIHRMLAEHFISNPSNLPTINHKDGDKLNNNLSNLEWVSYSENNKHAYEHHLKIVSEKVRQNARERAIKRNKKGKNAMHIRPIIELDIDGNMINEYPTLIEASIRTNVSKGWIIKVCKGKKKSVKNKFFKYKEEK